MSVWKELDGIKTQTLGSDLPDEFEALVYNAEGAEGKNGPILKVTLELEDGSKAITSYNIPKAWTGKGQMDLLKAHLETLNIGFKDMIGVKFLWRREKLPGSMQGNARHYPIKVVE